MTLSANRPAATGTLARDMIFATLALFMTPCLSTAKWSPLPCAMIKHAKTPLETPCMTGASQAAAKKEFARIGINASAAHSLAIPTCVICSSALKTQIARPNAARAMERKTFAFSRSTARLPPSWK